jgi:glycerol-3-phosphate acyltransferase PlsY
LIAAILTLLLAFALGSIPWGVIISRVFYKTDIRAHGSGNIGTTNAMRTLGKAGGAAVFVLDFCKGLLAGLVGLAASTWLLPGDAAADATRIIGFGWINSKVVLSLALFGCVSGHIFSPWLKFKGGKGIAVAIGCLFISFGWFWALVELGVFIVLTALTRYVSVGSIAAAVACPFVAWVAYWGDKVALTLSLLTAVLVIWAHRQNIKRLSEGNENRIGGKK